MGVKVLSTNRKARFEFFLLESFEAGISLQGSEIKSIRAGQISLSEAYVEIDGKDAWLVNAHIAPYNPANRYNHDPKRPRRLLLHKREIIQMWNQIRQKGVTVVPVQVYLKDGRCKIEVSIAKGKKLFDKRHEIARKDEEREIQREHRLKE
jgi:SsrA-binding protein